MAAADRVRSGDDVDVDVHDVDSPAAARCRRRRNAPRDRSAAPSTRPAAGAARCAGWARAGRLRARPAPRQRGRRAGRPSVRAPRVALGPLTARPRPTRSTRRTRDRPPRRPGSAPGPAAARSRRGAASRVDRDARGRRRRRSAPRTAGSRSTRWTRQRRARTPGTVSAAAHTRLTTACSLMVSPGSSSTSSGRVWPRRTSARTRLITDAVKPGSGCSAGSRGLGRPQVGGRVGQPEQAGPRLEAVGAAALVLVGRPVEVAPDVVDGATAAQSRVVCHALHPLGQLEPGPRDPPADGAHRQVQGGGDLVVRQLVDLAQAPGRPLTHGQLLQRGREVARAGRAARARVSGPASVAAGSATVPTVSTGCSGRRARSDVEAATGRDLVEPAAERLRARPGSAAVRHAVTKASCTTSSAVRRSCVSRHAWRKSGALVAPDQDGERLVVTADAAAHEASRRPSPRVGSGSATEASSWVPTGGPPPLAGRPR